jgi:hypothetical protein
VPEAEAQDEDTARGKEEKQKPVAEENVSRSGKRLISPVAERAANTLAER